MERRYKKIIGALILFGFLNTSLYGISNDSFLQVSHIDSEQSELNRVNKDLSDLRDPNLYKSALEDLIRLGEQDNIIALFNLAVLNEVKGQINISKRYYQRLIKVSKAKKNNEYLKKSFFNLGLILLREGDSNYIKNLSSAGELGIYKAYLILGQKLNNEKYFKLAIDNGVEFSNHFYSLYLSKIGKNDLAIKFARKSYELNENFINYSKLVSDKSLKLKILNDGVFNEDVESKEVLSNFYYKGYIVNKNLTTALSLIIDLKTEFSYFLKGEIYLDRKEFKKSYFNFNNYKFLVDNYSGEYRKTFNSNIDKICTEEPTLCLKF